MSAYRQAVEAAVRSVPAGEVTSYGEIAQEAGHPGTARGVGQILAGSEGLPWWRVVTAAGRLVPGKEAEHAARLRAEGVTIHDHHVVR